MGTAITNSLASNTPGIVNENYDPQYAPLNKAICNDDWNAVSAFLEGNEGAITARISVQGKTPLHVATLFGRLHIVEELLELLTDENVELRDISSKMTALHEAAYNKGIKIAKLLVGRNIGLLKIPTWDGYIPITRALMVGHMELVRYLYNVTPWEEFERESGTLCATFLNMCCYSQMFDLALDLLTRCPSLAITPDQHGSTFLQALASIPSAFPSGYKPCLLERWIYNRVNIHQELIWAGQHNNARSDNIMSKCFGIKNICQTKLTHKRSLELLRKACHALSELNVEQLRIAGVNLAVVQAAKNGIPEVITEVLKVHIHFLWDCQAEKSPIFYAVEFRQASVYSLIDGVDWKNAIANEMYNGNTLLHEAGTLSPETPLHGVTGSGAALQMQRELQWFKEVESITSSTRKESLNKDRLTPRALFTKDHKNLVKEGEKWMKTTAASCSVVASLVATIVFTAAFTVPGGNDQTTGVPIFRKRKSFILFIISDAVSLFSSATSILIFLAILTSRYAEDDFLISLPTKLIVGLSTLFVSMATMLIAFIAAIFITLQGKAWVVISLSSFACFPIVLFGVLQFPLLYVISKATYGPSIFARNVKPWLSG